MEGTKNIFTNPCEQQWENMTPADGCNRWCANCDQTIHDVTEMDLKTIAQDYIDSGKCVRMDAGQSHFFQYLRQLPRAATLSAALTLIPFAPLSAQENDTIDYCRISGIVATEQRLTRFIFIIVDGKTYRTKTNEFGFFQLDIPRNMKIEKTNIAQLKNRQLRRKDIYLKKAKIPALRTIGTPSF